MQGTCCRLSVSQGTCCRPSVSLHVTGTGCRPSVSLHVTGTCCTLFHKEPWKRWPSTKRSCKNSRKGEEYAVTAACSHRVNCGRHLQPRLAFRTAQAACLPHDTARCGAGLHQADGDDRRTSPPWDLGASAWIMEGNECRSSHYWSDGYWPFKLPAPANGQSGTGDKQQWGTVIKWKGPGDGCRAVLTMNEVAQWLIFDEVPFQRCVRWQWDQVTDVVPFWPWMRWHSD